MNSNPPVRARAAGDPGGGDPAWVEEVARRLLDHRDRPRPQAVDGGPDDAVTAYAIQAVLNRILAEERGVHPIGWKIAGTNATAREFLAIDGPFHGRLHDATTSPSPADLPAGAGFFRVFEAEIGLELGRDLPASGAPFTAADIEAATRHVLPSIEIVASCFEPWERAGAPNLIADNAAHGRWITGLPVADWSGLDLTDLAITVAIDGEVVATGSPRNVDGGPFGATAWLANTLSAEGLGLSAGDLVTTGITTVPVPAAPGRHVVADFGPLGSVELRLAPA